MICKARRFPGILTLVTVFTGVRVCRERVLGFLGLFIVVLVTPVAELFDLCDFRDICVRFFFVTAGASDVLSVLSNKCHSRVNGRGIPLVLGMTTGTIFAQCAGGVRFELIVAIDMTGRTILFSVNGLVDMIR